MINRLKSKDSAAYVELLALYKESVINTCFRFLLNQEDAEDIAQDVFVEVFLSIDQFRGEAKISTWIYRIAVTKCLDEIKKRQRKKRVATVGKLLHLDLIANWIGGGTMPDKELNEVDSENDVARVLNRLPENQRVAFTLSKIDGLTNSEIALIMNTTNVAVESLVYRAKKKATEELMLILKK